MITSYKYTCEMCKSKTNLFKSLNVKGKNYCYDCSKKINNREKMWNVGLAVCETKSNNTGYVKCDICDTYSNIKKVRLMHSKILGKTAKLQKGKVTYYFPHIKVCKDCVEKVPKDFIGCRCESQIKKGVLNER